MGAVIVMVPTWTLAIAAGRSVIGRFPGNFRSLLRSPLTSSDLERLIRHEVGMVNNDRFRRTLHQIAFRGVGGDDVADLVGHAGLHCQRDPGERMPQQLAAPGLHCLAAGAFVFQEFAHVGQDGAGDDGVHVDRQSWHELAHTLRRLARDMHDATLVLHEGRWAIRHQQREGNALQVFGRERAEFEGANPGAHYRVSQRAIGDPIQLGPEAANSNLERGGCGLRHASSVEPASLSRRRPACLWRSAQMNVRKLRPGRRIVCKASAHRHQMLATSYSDCTKTGELRVLSLTTYIQSGGVAKLMDGETQDFAVWAWDVGNQNRPSSKLLT